MYIMNLHTFLNHLIWYGVLATLKRKISIYHDHIANAQVAIKFCPLTKIWQVALKALAIMAVYYLISSVLRVIQAFESIVNTLISQDNVTEIRVIVEDVDLITKQVSV